MRANYLYILFFFILFFIVPSLSLLIEDDDKEREDTIYLKSNINEIYASTEITQYFINPLNNPIELIISFPIIEEISLNKFVIKVGEKKVISKVMQREEAEERYDESIYSGNTGFLGRYNDKDKKSYSIHIGNINPKEKLTLKSYFIQNIGTQDMSFEFIIMEKYPTFHYKELNQNEARNKIIKANFIIETQSKITRLIAPFFDEMAKKKSNYEVVYSNNYKKAEIFYIKNPDNIQNKDIIDKRYGKEFGYPGKVNEPTFLISFSILFRTENINKPILYYQYDPKLKETSYSINYVYSSEKLKNIPIPEIPDEDNRISYYAKYENDIINDTPALFIFLVDQSGSMTGNSINIVRQSLLLFIQSLPPGSYFQIIGFGSYFKKYNEEPVEYNKENVDNIIHIINNLKADLGGTNINSPLESIYNSKSYDKINLSKHIFLLTDGQVNDRDGCISLITANANKFRIHAFGIGRSFDRYFIERSGKLGKGSYFFIEEDIQELSSIIIIALNNNLRPYLVDIHFNFNNYLNKIKNNVISCEPNRISNQDEIINYSFILDEKNNINIEKLLEPIILEISAKNPNNIIKENISFNKNENIIKLPDGNELSKMIVGKALKKNKDLINDKNKEINFSIKYQILSENTALFAEIINETDDMNKNKLITVNLDDYIQKIKFEPPNPQFNSKKYKTSKRKNDDKKRTLGSGSILNGIDIGTISYSIPSDKTFIDIDKYNSLDHLLDSEDAFYNSLKSSNDKIEGVISEIGGAIIQDSEASSDINCFNCAQKGSINNIELKRKDIMKLILSQNIIEGYWDENEESKELMNIIDKDKMNKINIKIKSLNKGEEIEKRIKYTILVIYFLNTEYYDKIDDYKLIINKAEKYLMNQGIQYKDIIKLL